MVRWGDGANVTESIDEERQVELRRGADPQTLDELTWVIFDGMRRYVSRETSFVKLEKAMRAAYIAVTEFSRDIVAPLEEEGRLREWI